MTEVRVPCGEEAAHWERDSKLLRRLLQESGYSQAAAAGELGIGEREMRSLCSGREPVPRAVIYAMRWVIEHKPNQVRWLQVHWKKAGLEVEKTDRFEIRCVNEIMGFYVNGRIAMRGRFEDLLDRGLLSVHTSYSSDRFLWNPGAATVANPQNTEPAELDETVGVVGYRLSTSAKGHYPVEPFVQLFSANGRARLSHHLMSNREITEAIESLELNVRSLGESAKRALAEARRET